MSTKTGQIKVDTQNIFPIIKKWLYSEHDIFLRELVSNSCDAITKRETLSRQKNLEVPTGAVEVTLSKADNTITIKDNGLGMSEAEIEKYITQLAFSGAEEFVDKMKEAGIESKSDIIGKFGLGFYSAFMVADKVEIETKSMSDEPAVHWICTGQTDYTVAQSAKETIGTEITLHLNEESKEFLESWKTREVIKKYCAFMPYSINLIDLDHRAQTIAENAKAEKEEDKKPISDDIVNSTNPLWKKSPNQLKDEDYLNFYKELYPMSEEPLFWLHLNVDHPFDLQGILYFPKIDPRKPVQENSISLYAKQVFVSQDVKNIIPEFLSLLKGVIDSPDIPLNVSRSSLQGDPNIKKISNYIVKKVAESLKKLFKTDRNKFETIWEDVSLFAKYGILSDPKFAESARTFLLFKNHDDKLLTLNEYKENLPEEFKEKVENKIITFTHAQKDSAILDEFRAKSIPCFEVDEYMDQHLTQNLEFSSGEEKIQFTSIDTEYENLFTSEAAENEKLKEVFSTIAKATSESFDIEVKNYAAEQGAAYLKENLQMKRFKAMSSQFGGQNDMQVPMTLVLNESHPLITKVSQLVDGGKEVEAKDLAQQVHDLSLLSEGKLPTEKLKDFIKRTQDLLLK